MIANAYTNGYNHQCEISCNNNSVYYAKRPWKVFFEPKFPPSAPKKVLDGFLNES